MTSFSESISLDELEEDPYPIYARLRQEEPVVWIPVLNAWLVTRWDDVRQVLAFPESFVTDSQAAPLGQICGADNMLSVEGDKHAEWRRRADEVFFPEAADEVVSFTQARAEELIRNLEDGDILSGYLEQVGVRTVAYLMGLAPHAEINEIISWSTGITTGLGNPSGDLERAKRAARATAEMQSRLGPVVERLAGHPDGSLISHLSSGRDGSGVMDQLRSMTLSVRQPGWIAANVLHALLTHPEQMNAVHRAPDLLSASIHEGLRWAPAVSILDRWTTHRVDLGGKSIPANAMLAVGIASANRDHTGQRGAQIGPAPDSFDITRPRRPHVTLGYARHSCLMTPFIPQVVETMISVLLDHYPHIRLAGTAPRPHGWKFRRFECLPVVLR